MQHSIIRLHIIYERWNAKIRLKDTRYVYTTIDNVWYYRYAYLKVCIVYTSQVMHKLPE